jgi:hypothetical protein
MVIYNRPVIRPGQVNDMRNVTTIRRRPKAAVKILLGTRMQAESGASHRKQRTGTHSTRYAKGRCLASRDALPGSGPFASRPFLSGKNPPGKRFLIETLPRIEIPVSDRKQRTGPFLIETRSVCCGHPDFSSRKGVHENKMRPFQLVNLRGEADERSVGFGRLYLVRRSRTLSLRTFPSTVLPSSRASAALITAPICFNESAPASAMASSMAWWTS